MTLDECYSILGVKKGVSLDELKQTYRDMVKAWHPDRYREDPAFQIKAENKLKEINIAYHTLEPFLKRFSEEQKERERREQGGKDANRRGNNNAGKGKRKKRRQKQKKKANSGRRKNAGKGKREKKLQKRNKNVKGGRRRNAGNTVATASLHCMLPYACLLCFASIVTLTSMTRR